MSRRPLRIHCRQIHDSDINPVIDLLLKSGFPGSRQFWARGLQRLSEHPTPPGLPKYGFLLEVNELPVGMLLLISSSIIVDGQSKVRCNVSSWFVWPAFRNYAAMLVSRALRYKDVTYFNISPLPHTLPILDAQGFTQYCNGRFVAVPALKWGARKARVIDASSGIHIDNLHQTDIELLARHMSYGCIGVTVTSGDRPYVFVFEPRRRWYGMMPAAYLVYCPSIDAFADFAGPLGRFLAKRGYLIVVLDANGPVPGLIGRYTKSTPKYFRGPDRPRLGDLADTEQVILGVIA